MNLAIKSVFMSWPERNAGFGGHEEFWKVEYPLILLRDLAWDPKIK